MLALNVSWEIISSGALKYATQFFQVNVCDRVALLPCFLKINTLVKRVSKSNNLPLSFFLINLIISSSTFLYSLNTSANGKTL